MGNKKSKARPPSQQQPEQEPELLLDVLKRGTSPPELQEFFACGCVANVNATDRDGKTALFCVHTAESAAILLKDNTDVNARDHASETSLFSAVKSENTGVVKLLLENGTDVHARDVREKMALHFTRTAETVQLLVAHDADVNATDKNEDSPLFEAARFMAPQVAEALITAGADAALANAAGESVTFAVTSIASVSTLKLPIQHSGPVNVCTPWMETPMHTAACFSVDIVQFMIDHGVPVDTVSTRCSTLLNVAVLHGHLDIVKLLLESNANVHGSESYYKTPLLKAAENGRLDNMAELVAHGASFDSQAADGDTQAAIR